VLIPTALWTAEWPLQLSGIVHPSRSITTMRQVVDLDQGTLLLYA
jgi:hypothetical protein